MKWRIFGSISGLSLALASGWACSSSSSSSSSGGGLAGACQRVASATSAFAQRCGETLTAAGASDHDTHDIARSAALCVAKYSLPGISDPTATLDTCASDLAVAACNTEGELPSCVVALAGTRSDGTSCAENEQCAGGICLFSQSDAGSGVDAGAITCGACATAIAAGQPCTDPNLCASGDCQGSSATSVTCEPVATLTAAIGAACDDESIGCAPPGICNTGNTGSSSGTCIAAAKLGESCGNDSSSPCEFPLTCASSVCAAAATYGQDCSSKQCAVGLYCGSSETCLSITYGPPGATCNGSSLQCIQGTCPRSGGANAACPAIIADGQPCTPGVSIPSCDTLAACSNGVCSLLPGSSSCP